MNKEPFAGDRNDFASIEQYVDNVLSHMLESPIVAEARTPGDMLNTVIDLFRDHLIWEINPDYFA